MRIYQLLANKTSQSFGILIHRPAFVVRWRCFRCPVQAPSYSPTLPPSGHTVVLPFLILSPYIHHAHPPHHISSYRAAPSQHAGLDRRGTARSSPYKPCPDTNLAFSACSKIIENCLRSRRRGKLPVRQWLIVWPSAAPAAHPHARPFARSFHPSVRSSARPPARSSARAPARPSGRPSLTHLSFARRGSAMSGCGGI